MASKKKWTSQIPPPKPEEIVVNGGGLNGCLTALFAARVTNPDGSPKYHVTLLEKGPRLFDKTSLIASRLHLGGEYPLDLKTGLDCLKGGLILKMVMPKSIYSDRVPMKFTVAKATEEHGKNIEHENSYERDASKHNNKYLTAEKYKEHYEKICEQYKDYFDQIKASPYFAEIKKAKGWQDTMTPEQADKHLAEELFGLPVKGKKGGYKEHSKDAFYWHLSDKELRKISPHISGGFQSQEKGFNIPIYLSFLQRALEDQSNIDIKYNSKTTKVQKAGGKFEVSYEADGIVKTAVADQVVEAAWDGNPKITGAKDPFTIYRRAMLLMDVSRVEGFEKLDPTFVMLGRNGGMLSPYNMDTAIGYLPGEEIADDARKEAQFGPDQGSYMGFKKIHPDGDDWNTPPGWNDSEEDKESRMRKIFDGLVKLFPFLKGPTPETSAQPKKLLVGNTLNFQNSLEQRRHQPTQEVVDEQGNAVPGHLVVYATKATLAPQSAIEAVEMIKKRSRLREQQTPDAPIGAVPDALDLVMQNQYSLRAPDIALPAQDTARQFARQHDLPEDMASQHALPKDETALHVAQPPRYPTPKEKHVVYKNPPRKPGNLIVSQPVMEMQDNPVLEMLPQLPQDLRKTLFGEQNINPLVGTEKWQAFEQEFTKSGLTIPQDMTLRDYLVAFSQPYTDAQDLNVPGYHETLAAMRKKETNIISLALPMVFDNLSEETQKRITDHAKALQLVKMLSRNKE